MYVSVFKNKPRFEIEKIRPAISQSGSLLRCVRSKSSLCVYVCCQWLKTKHWIV